MLETLASLDRALFLYINVHLANPVTDIIMPVITSDNFLRTIYALAMLILFWRGNRVMRWMVVFSAVTIGVTDFLGAHFLKEFVARPRPCASLTDVHALVTCGAGYSMPSAHAANSFGQARLFSSRYRAATWYLYAFATLIALSRVFVGVHYPADILVGAVIGVVLGSLMAFVARISLARLSAGPLGVPGKVAQQESDATSRKIL